MFKGMDLIDADLAEVPHQVTALAVILGEDIEQEGLHVVVERLVIEEQLGDVAQVFRVNLLLLRVKLKHADLVISVYLITWRAPYVASLRVGL